MFFRVLSFWLQGVYVLRVIVAQPIKKFPHLVRIIKFIKSDHEKPATDSTRHHLIFHILE
jgi:hypothetical protein